MTTQILLAGFGGQGILFAGKFLATAGLLEDRQVSWLPSYGPEMRGGTASCSVILSDEPIGSPIVLAPDVLVVMNLPSFARFEPAVKPGGLIFADSSLIETQSQRGDVTSYALPATQLATDEHLDGLANMILLGKLVAMTKLCRAETAELVVQKTVPAKKQHLLEANLRALRLGGEYE